MKFLTLQFPLVKQFRRFYSAYSPEELKKLVIKRRSIQKRLKEVEESTHIYQNGPKVKVSSKEKPTKSSEKSIKSTEKHKKVDPDVSFQNAIVAYYDLETTGLSVYQDEIISIGAVTQFGNTFDTYILPDQNIKWGATQTHGIVKYRNRLFNFEDKFFYHSVAPREGLAMFQQWLCDNKVNILVSHNNLRFDSMILKNCMSRVGLEFFTNLYLVDSLEIMRCK